MSNLYKATSKRNSHRVIALFTAAALFGNALLVPYLSSSTVYADNLRAGQVSSLSNVTKIAAGHIHSSDLRMANSDSE